MFESFTKNTIKLDVAVNYVVGGCGPPILLLHGYPQTHFMWHKIANQLAENYTVLASDLRGYGDSAKPPTNELHCPYVKRASARDQLMLMNALGFRDFYLAGHDRGGCVGHRMTLDYEDAATDVEGHAIPCGHYLAEEAPEETLTAVLNFLEK